MLLSCGPDRPSEAQVREAVAKSVSAWGDDAAFSLEEFEVRDWADVRPGLVRVRVYARCETATGDADVDAALNKIATAFKPLTGPNVLDGTELKFELERWDSGWRAKRLD